MAPGPARARGVPHIAHDADVCRMDNRRRCSIPAKSNIFRTRTALYPPPPVPPRAAPRVAVQNTEPFQRTKACRRVVLHPSSLHPFTGPPEFQQIKISQTKPRRTANAQRQPPVMSHSACYPDFSSWKPRRAARPSLLGRRWSCARSDGAAAPHSCAAPRLTWRRPPPRAPMTRRRRLAPPRRPRH